MGGCDAIVSLPSFLVCDACGDCTPRHASLPDFPSDLRPISNACAGKPQSLSRGHGRVVSVRWTATPRSAESRVPGFQFDLLSSFLSSNAGSSKSPSNWKSLMVLCNRMASSFFDAHDLINQEAGGWVVSRNRGPGAVASS